MSLVSIFFRLVTSFDLSQLKLIICRVFYDNITIWSYELNILSLLIKLHISILARFELHLMSSNHAPSDHLCHAHEDQQTFEDCNDYHALDEEGDEHTKVAREEVGEILEDLGNRSLGKASSIAQIDEVIINNLLQLYLVYDQSTWKLWCIGTFNYEEGEQHNCKHL